MKSFPKPPAPDPMIVGQAQTEEYPGVSFCGCCGRQMSGTLAEVHPCQSEPDHWCQDCEEHLGPRGTGGGPWDRTYGAMNHGDPCPFEGPL